MAAARRRFETLVLAYADETSISAASGSMFVDPGATRTRMRQLAFPGEEPRASNRPKKSPRSILGRLLSDVKTGERVRVEV
jgi:hypothetical protein